VVVSSSLRLRHVLRAVADLWPKGAAALVTVVWCARILE
jgi:hypothetical protein